MFFRRLVTAMAVLTLSTLTSAATATSKGVELPSSAPELHVPTVHGCYSSLGLLKLNTTYIYNTQSWCTELCFNNTMPVAASYATSCYCGDKYPNEKFLVDDTKCNEPCPGFDEQACGGLDTYTVYNTGVVVGVDEYAVNAGEETTTSSVASSTTTSAAAHTATSATEDSQVTVTAPAAAESTTSNKKSSSSSGTVGIAVGVVVGVLVAAAIAGGAFFFVRRKRNSALEEEHRRNAAVNAFISGGKPPSSSGGMSMADSRMDPVMNRRLSDGSIADNQDYSRRILRVTNA
ncbi:hypothetical protein F5Y18DRAFT_75070 [Xylariaceae sp. FL1019]|nr:hypothetical protein F5Y18DRAFT_75070 [Xylariaceae sp. FL1019]